MIQASVIIPTRDRAELLRLCLESLTRQTLAPGDFEVIVVDNGSCDSTPEVAAAYSTRLDLRYVAAPEPGLHVGRHAGMRAARAGVLMYADDDIEACPRWVEAVVRAFGAPHVALVGGNNYPRFEHEPPAWLRKWWSEPVREVRRGRALGYLSVLDFGTGRFPLDSRFVWGCNFSVRRQALEAVGGFHPDSVPKDRLRLRGDGESHVANEIRKRGWVTMFDSDASVHHLVSTERMTRAYFEQRGFAQGISDSYTAVRRHRSASLPASQAFRTRLRSALGAFRERWRVIGASDVAARELMKVRIAALRAWADGYAFHQAALRSDADLLQWVMKEDYLT